jgi:uncharacterized membrane protein
VNAIRFFLSGVCHQLPDHSLHVGGSPLLLCARCTGTHVGVVLALIVLWALGEGRRRRLPPSRAMALLGLLAGAWAVDGLNSLSEWVTGAGVLYEPSNVLRLATGVGMGMAIGALLYPILQFVLWETAKQERVLSSWRCLVALMGSGGLAVLALLLMRPLPRVLWMLLSVGPVTVTLSLANALLVVLLLHREGSAQGWSQVVPYLGAGFLVSLAETGALGLTRSLLGV